MRYERLKTIMEHIFLTLTENETVARITCHNICGKMTQKNCKTLWDSVVTFLSLKVKPPAREPVVTPAYYGPFAEYEEPATGWLLGWLKVQFKFILTSNRQIVWGRPVIFCCRSTVAMRKTSNKSQTRELLV